MSQTEQSAKLGDTHGYRITGDLACLNAELLLTPAAREQWALQLWACDQPYAGGLLSGTKVAEAPLELQGALSDGPHHAYAETLAQPPAGDKDYSMVLVLASRADRERVHDFANYPAREHFRAPRLRGALRVTYQDEKVTLYAERIDNPRDAENLSGTLALELWALPVRYAGGAFEGQRLAAVEIGRLAGQHSLLQLEHQLALAPVTHAPPHRVWMLREWTAAGYVTRDYREATAPEARDVQRTPQSAPALISIQHASHEELARVPGLNAKLATAIIKARPFRSFDQLKRVRGIGDATLRRLRSVLVL